MGEINFCSSVSVYPQSRMEDYYGVCEAPEKDKEPESKGTRVVAASFGRREGSAAVNATEGFARGFVSAPFSLTACSSVMEGNTNPGDEDADIIDTIENDTIDVLEDADLDIAEHDEIEHPDIPEDGDLDVVEFDEIEHPEIPDTEEIDIVDIEDGDIVDIEDSDIPEDGDIDQVDIADGDIIEDEADGSDGTDGSDGSDSDVLGVCQNIPTAPILVSPQGALPHTRTVGALFKWQKSEDPDLGDEVSYCLEITNTDTSAPVPISCPVYPTESGNLMATTVEGLEYANYSWRVVASDLCNDPDHSVSSEPTTFSIQQQVCVPQGVQITDFSGGTFTDTEIVNGAVVPIEDQNAWTVKYDASTGLLPSESTPAWTEYAPLGWTCNAVEDGALHISTLTTGDRGFYSIAPNFQNSVGFVVEARMRSLEDIVVFGGLSLRFVAKIEGVDAEKAVFIRFNHNSVSDGLDVGGATVDTVSTFNTYRIFGKQTGYTLLINGDFGYSASYNTGASTFQPVENYLKFGDVSPITNQNSNSLWEYIYFYNEGDSLPRVNGGEYLSNPIDLGESQTNLGQGAVLSAQSEGVSFDIYSSDDTVMPEAPCATGIVDPEAEIIPPFCDGRYLWLKGNLLDQNATLQEVDINYCNY